MQVRFNEYLFEAASGMAVYSTPRRAPPDEKNSGLMVFRLRCLHGSGHR
jgi:hypothetical protein